MKEFFLQTSDGYKISVHLFSPKKSNGKLLLINSATGVKQQVYFSFSKFLAKNGFTVLTYDYRGIGLSKPQKMKGFFASMRIWGTHDYKALTNYIAEHYAHFEKFCLGHSVGALILGMNYESKMFKKFVFVATQKAHVSNLTTSVKLMSYIGFGLLQPASTKVFGYFPAHRFGLGESLPKNVAYDWRTLILHPKSTNKLLEKIQNYSENLHQKVLVISAEDDPWVTQKGMDTLLAETYPNLQPEFRHLQASESDKNEIGHINFFRSYNQNLWKIPLDWMNK